MVRWDSIELTLKGLEALIRCFTSRETAVAFSGILSPISYFTKLPIKMISANARLARRAASRLATQSSRSNPLQISDGGAWTSMALRVQSAHNQASSSLISRRMFSSSDTDKKEDSDKSEGSEEEKSEEGKKGSEGEEGEGEEVRRPKN